MSTDDKYTVADLLQHSIEQQPLEFENTFNNMMLDRLNAAIETRKNEIAQTMFGQPDDPEEFDDEDEDISFGDEDEVEDAEDTEQDQEEE